MTEIETKKGKDEKETKDWITQEPVTVKLIKMEKMKAWKEHGYLMKKMGDKHVTVKEIREFFYNEKEDTYERGLKSIYRDVEKLQKEELIIECGQRMTEGSRAVETLYCKAARVIFFDDESHVEMWKEQTNRNLIDIMRLLVEKELNISVSTEEFFDFAYDYYKENDAVSTAMLEKHIEKDDEILEKIKDLEPHQIKTIIFDSSALAMTWKNCKK